MAYEKSRKEEKEKSKEMMDNRMVKDDHKRGIDRVKDIGKTMNKGQGGKMYSSCKTDKNDFKRSSSMTPRKA